MLHSLLILNDDSYVLFARYFDPAVSLDARKRFETQLARLSSQLPHAASTSTHKASATATGGDQLLVCENQFVVVRSVGELRVILSGSREYDELVCEYWHSFATSDSTIYVFFVCLVAEIVGLVQAVLVTQLEKKLTEASLLANYPRVVAALDEMVQHGHLETSDELAIEQMSKFKPFPVK
jgi:hypothetical protein